MHEVARVIAQVEPRPPSDIVTTTEAGAQRAQTPITPAAVSSVREGDPDSLRKRLAGDLDAILLTALRKEPEQRYSSAEALAEDLARHLEHRPVTARPASPWYRFKRFCRRNPGGVVAGALVAASFLGSGASVVWQARHDIDAAIQDPSRQVFLAPVLLFSFTFSLVAFIGILFFFRPSRIKLAGAVAGAIAWGLAILGKWWVEGYLGWWRSRFAGTEDPLLLLVPGFLPVYVLVGALLLLLLSFIGRRFGWKAQVISLLVLGLYQASRERVWYGTLLPALTFEPGPLPLLGSTAMLALGAAIGLAVMHVITRTERSVR
jgi:hypothetical protein